MKLAEDFTIHLTTGPVELRPTLFHAIRLERREGGFRQLLQELGEGSLTAAVAIIEPFYDGDLIEVRVFDVLAAIRPTLIAYVLACAGIDPDKAEAAEGEKPRKAQPERPFATYLTDLYRYGTGWLGWTPEQTLASTPAEITLAFEGHIDALRAIHGHAAPEQPKDERPLGDKFRSIFASHGTVKSEAM